MLRVRARLCRPTSRAGPERTLAERYLERAGAAGRAVGLGVEIREIARITRPPRRGPQSRRGQRRFALRCPPMPPLIVLDEVGTPMDSVAFAGLVGCARRDDGTPVLVMVIGGADGLDPSLRREAVATIAFGAMTWPHQLVRIMAAEQIYRAGDDSFGAPVPSGLSPSFRASASEDPEPVLFSDRVKHTGSGAPE